MSHFLSLEITVPSVVEQRAIAHGLDRLTARINDATTNARRAAELARERRAALISAAVTGKIDVGTHA